MIENFERTTDDIMKIFQDPYFQSEHKETS